MLFMQIGDIHLDRGSAFGQGWAKEVAEKLRSTSEWAVNQKVDFVLDMGDQFSARLPDLVTEEDKDHYLYGLEPLFDAGIPVVTLPGNHAWDGKRTALTSLCKLGRYSGLLYDLADGPWTHKGTGCRVVGVPYNAAVEKGEVSLYEHTEPQREMLRGANVWAFHGTFRGDKYGYGSIGGQDPLDLFFGVPFDIQHKSRLEAFHIASGHIHKAMKVYTGAGAMYYAGAFLPTLFGEAEYRTGVLMVEINSTNQVEFVEVIPKTPIVRMQERDQEIPDGAIVQVTWDIPEDELMVLRKKYPVVRVKSRVMTRAEERHTALEAGKVYTPIEVFDRFVSSVADAEGLPAEKQEIADMVCKLMGQA